MRRFIRRLGSLLILAGILTLVWVVVVWQWQDPFTSVYTRWKQHQLATSYKRRIEHFGAVHIAPGASLAAAKREIAREAARYRKTSKRGQAIARIKVPRLGLNMVVVNGTDHDSLMKGPGRDMLTYMPGQSRLVYIAGHRTTYLAPFAHIDSLHRGDPVTLELPYATFRYQVVRHRVVKADDLAVLRSPRYDLLALQACHPRSFASHRYIVYAKPVRVEPRGGPAYALAAGPRLNQSG
jgi:sortase A